MHARKIPTLDNDIISMIETLTKPDNPAMDSWLRVTQGKLPSSGFTPLHVAAWGGISEYVKHAIAAGQDCNALDSHARNSLIWAAERGHDKVVELLLPYTVDHGKGNFQDMTALHYAAQADHHKVVRLLLQARVSVLVGRTKTLPPQKCDNAPSNYGETPLQYACESASTKSIREEMPYMDCKDLYEAARWVAKGGSIEVLDTLLASPNLSLDSEGRLSLARVTPLFCAASRRRADMIQSLLRKGADLNERSRDPEERRQMIGLTMVELRRTRTYPSALHAPAGCTMDYSRSTNEEDIKACFNLLLSAGADVNAVD